MDNLSFYDLLEGKDKELFTPTVWSCLKTCKNFSCTLPDGSIDYFPETREKRCVNTDFKCKLVNNYWVTTCKNYKR